MIRAAPLALGFLILFHVPARADIDHLCLNQCKQNGASSTACLSQCSYGVDPASVKPTTPVAKANALTAQAAAHRVLKTPIPIGSQLILHPQTKSVPNTLTPTLSHGKDYACFNACLQNRLAYAYCEQRCATK